MSLKVKNKDAISKYIQRQKVLIEKALIFNLEALVSELQTHAKNNAGYEDQTSNLKSSIGGVLLKNKRPVTYRGFEGESDGTSTGLEFINSLISDQNNGYVIVIVAGMEYATYVEDIHQLNVLKKTELKMNRDLPLLLKKLSKKIS